MLEGKGENPKATARTRKPLPLAWLLLIDAVLIVGGFGVFAFFYTAVPSTYAEVPPPARRSPTVVNPIAVSPIVASPIVAGPTAAALGARGTVAAGPAAGEAASTPARAAMRSRGQELDMHAGPAPAPAAAVPTVAPPATAAPAGEAPAGGQELGNGKLADKFTGGEVERTATTYRSADVNVTLTQVQQNGVRYYVQDIYVRYVDKLRTAFAQNKYGRWISDWTPNIAQANDAIAAINGDWYGAGTLGVVIRNGVLYNDRTDGDVAVLYRDGTMRAFSAAGFDAAGAMANGAYQAWSFGPSLLGPNGEAIGSFHSGIAGRNPRTALGYYEPGHYAFVVVDGRQPGYSNGMSLAQLSALFAGLGCKVAYNLDGGQSSVMTFGGQVVNRPYKGGRPTSDIIYVGE